MIFLEKKNTIGTFTFAFFSFLLDQKAVGKADWSATENKFIRSLFENKAFLFFIAFHNVLRIFFFFSVGNSQNVLFSLQIVVFLVVVCRNIVCLFIRDMSYACFLTVTSQILLLIDQIHSFVKLIYLAPKIFLFQKCFAL